MPNDAIERARQALTKDYPDVAGAPISPYGPILRHLVPGSSGVTGPLGGIYVNAYPGLPDRELESTIVHELTHRRQAKEHPIRNLLNLVSPRSTGYGQKPEELEAFQAERERELRLGLPHGTGHPSFTGAPLREEDIRLYPERVPPSLAALRKR